MGVILEQLGIDWKLLLAQGVNFFIVLVILTLFVWKPLLSIMKARKEKIEKGFQDADEAKRKLTQSEAVMSEKVREGEQKALVIIADAEKRAGERASGVIKDAELKANTILKQGFSILEHKRDEQYSNLLKRSKVIIRNALAKAVATDPDEIDNKLITQAEGALKEELKI